MGGVVEKDVPNAYTAYLLHIFQDLKREFSHRDGYGQRTYHVAMSVECLDTRKQLFVVSKGDKNLRVIPHCLLKDGQGSLADFMLF